MWQFIKFYWLLFADVINFQHDSDDLPDSIPNYKSRDEPALQFFGAKTLPPRLSIADRIRKQTAPIRDIHSTVLSPNNDFPSTVLPTIGESAEATVQQFWSNTGILK